MTQQCEASNSYEQLLREAYTYTPLPISQQSFAATCVWLRWQTADLYSGCIAGF